MSDHTVFVQPHPQAHGLLVRCSCQTAYLAHLGVGWDEVLLNEISAVAHEHITAVTDGWPDRPTDDPTARVIWGDGDPYVDCSEVAGREYVHGLDPEDDDPRRDVLDG